MNDKELRELAERLISLLEASPRPFAEDDDGERHEATLLAAQQLTRIIARTPWPAIPPAWLDPVQSRFQDAAQAVDEYNSTFSEPDIDSFPIDWDEIEGLWASLAPFLPAMLQAESVAEDATSFRRSAGQHLRRIGEEAEVVHDELRRLRSQLSAVERERDQALEVIQKEQRRLVDVIDQQQRRLDEAIRQNQAQFSTAQERHSEQVAALIVEKTKDLDDMVGTADTVAADALSKRELAAEQVLERLDDLEQKALKSYNTIGNASVAGHYQRDANKQGWQANFWRGIAVSVFLLIGLGTITELAVSGGSIGWDETRSRIPIIVGLGGLAAFAVAEAGTHRKAERASRQREVELSSLDPFLALVDPTEAERVKIAYARRVFVDQPIHPYLAQDEAQDDEVEEGGGLA